MYILYENAVCIYALLVVVSVQLFLLYLSKKITVKTNSERFFTSIDCKLNPLRVRFRLYQIIISGSIIELYGLFLAIYGAIKTDSLSSMSSTLLIFIMGVLILIGNAHLTLLLMHQDNRNMYAYYNSNISSMVIKELSEHERLKEVEYKLKIHVDTYLVNRFTNKPKNSDSIFLVFLVQDNSKEILMQEEVPELLKGLGESLNNLIYSPNDTFDLKYSIKIQHNID